MDVDRGESLCWARQPVSVCRARWVNGFFCVRIIMRSAFFGRGKKRDEESPSHVMHNITWLLWSRGFERLSPDPGNPL